MVYLLTRMLFSAMATASLVLASPTTTLERLLLGLGEGLAAARSRQGRGLEIRRRVGRSGLGGKQSKGVPPLLIRRFRRDVGRRGGGHLNELLVVYIKYLPH